MSVAMWGARSRAMSLLVAVLLVSLGLTESTQILVGGTKGWTTGFDYDTWLTNQNIQFHVADSLTFSNHDELSHTVAMVGDATSYQLCNLGSASNITPVPSGTNYTYVIPASLQGQTLYLVCTISGHCSDMQKIHGTVLAAVSGTNGTTPTPSPPATTPATPSDADMNRLICWTTAILLIAACFWSSG